MNRYIVIRSWLSPQYKQTFNNNRHISKSKSINSDFHVPFIISSYHTFPSRKSPSITTPPHIRHLRPRHATLDILLLALLADRIGGFDGRTLELGHELAQSRHRFGLVVRLWALFVGLDVDVLLSNWLWLLCGG